VPQTDLYAVIAIHIGILLLTLCAAACDFRAYLRAKSGMTDARVIRGESSMNAIYTVYGASIASCLFLIEAATAIEGNKVKLSLLVTLYLLHIYFSSIHGSETLYSSRSKAKSPQIKAPNNALNCRSLRSLDVQKLRFWPPVSLIVRQI